MEKSKNKKSGINKKKLIISIIIIAIMAIAAIISCIIFNNKNQNYIADSEEVINISSIIYNINDNYINHNGKLIGKKIKYSEAEEVISNINSYMKLKISDYDGFEVNENYYYYVISGRNLKDYGIKKLGSTYIINYATGEVINKNVSEYSEIGEVYSYREDLTLLNILEGKVDTYNITYDLDGGEIPNESENINSYNQTMEYQLLNPIKEGYIFIGWTGSNGDTPETSVTITKGSTGDKQYKANYEIEQESNPEEIIEEEAAESAV